MALTQPRAAFQSDGAWLLLAELNHRFRNELQVALSALRLARRQAASSGPDRLIEEAVVRLEGLGSVRQILDHEVEHGPLTQRLEALCRATSLSKASPLGIRLVLKMDEVAADDEAAWTVCVVASELMSNALKHAFPRGGPGVINVVLRQDDAEVLLTVADDGVGSAASGRSMESLWQAAGFGSAIVNQLAARLGGGVTRVSSPVGTTVTLSLPASRSH